MTLLPTIALIAALLTTQGLLVYVVCRLLKQDNEHTKQLKTVTDECMNRIQAGTLQDYTLHLERAALMAKEPEPESQSEPELPDPDIMDPEEYNLRLADAQAGYYEHMGRTI